MKFRALVANDTFIGRYMQRFDNQETAEAYDFYCALWLLSIACGRNVYVARPRAPVYLNLYAILVAESGITRKSTAVRYARGLAYDVLGIDGPMRLLEGRTTPEKLNQLLHERAQTYGCSQVAFAVSELANFLGTEGYTYGLPTLLTDLYDCPSERALGGTMRQDEMFHRDVFVSFLSASAPSWLLRVVNPIVIEGGFTSRCLFIHSEKPKKRIAWPIDEADTDRDWFITRLRQTRDVACAIQSIGINDRALSAFTQWYESCAVSTDHFRKSFESREDAHVLRIAALLCVNDGTWVIQHQHIMCAINLVAQAKSDGAKIFELGSTQGEFLIGANNLRMALIHAGDKAVPKHVLHMRCKRYINGAGFDALLDMMHEAGMIQRFEVAPQGRGRPTELIRGTRKLLKHNAVTELARGL